MRSFVTSSGIVLPIRLPVRLGGAGIRSLVDVCDAAFLGGVSQAFPFLINQISDDGVVRQGCCHSALEESLGAGSFDHNNITPFHTFLSTNLPTARRVLTAYTNLQEEAQDRPGFNDLTLAFPAEQLGLHAENGKVQHLLTKEIEEGRATQLKAEFREQEPSYFPGQAALNCDRISSVFLTALPTESNTCLDCVWRAGFANHFGLPYDAFARNEGEPLLNVKKGAVNSTFDKYGNVLGLAKVKGCGGQMKRHDGIAWLLMDLMADAGYNYQHEASFIFRDCVSEDVFRRWQEATTGRKGNFITPDIYFVPGQGVRPTLADIKCMYGGTAYTKNRTTQCGVVAAKQARVKKEYTNRAHVLDKKYNDTADNEVGKVQTRLEEFGDIKIPVAGMFNEISRDFHDIIKFTAQDVAKVQFQTTTLPVQSASELIGPIMWSMKQKVGMHLFRTGMAFKFDRLYLCTGLSHSSSYASEQRFFRNRSTYTTLERTMQRWAEVHRAPVSAQQW